MIRFKLKSKRRGVPYCSTMYFAAYGAVYVTCLLSNQKCIGFPLCVDRNGSACVWQDPYTWYRFGEVLLHGHCYALGLVFFDKAVALLPPGLEQQEKVSNLSADAYHAFTPFLYLVSGTVYCSSMINRYINRLARARAHLARRQNLRQLLCFSLAVVNVIRCPRDGAEEKYYQ